MKARNRVKDALEIDEDRGLAEMADRRLATFDRKTAKSHVQIWGALKRHRRCVSFDLLHHPAVGEEDIPGIPRNLHRRIADAIESRLTLQPHQYGAPLRKTLKGFWRLRVGDYRVVHKLEKDDVLILAIRHRKTVYDDMLRRIDQDN